jgi:16S rRNA (guanine527-N7)-methyltransferase
MNDRKASDTLLSLVDADGADLLTRYLEAMLAENEHVNLTAIRDPGHAFVLHVLDSLALGLVVAAAPQRVLDLGTGNGFPGIAARALWPTCRVTLCDRTHKKIAAITRALAAANIDAVEAIAVDATQAPKLQPTWLAAFDVVTVRAVDTPQATTALSRPFVRPAGAVVLWLDADTHAPGVRGYEPPHVRDYALPEPTPRTRRLACYRRIKS